MNLSSIHTDNDNRKVYGRFPAPWIHLQKHKKKVMIIKNYIFRVIKKRRGEQTHVGFLQILEGEGALRILVVFLQICFSNVWQLLLLPQLLHFVGAVFEDDVCFGVLEGSQGDEHKVVFVDPHFFHHFAPDVALPTLPVETKGLESAVAQHFHHLRVLLPVLFEDQFAFHLFVLVFAAATAFASFAFILWHFVEKRLE